MKRKAQKLLSLALCSAMIYGNTLSSVPFAVYAQGQEISQEQGSEQEQNNTTNAQEKEAVENTTNKGQSETQNTPSSEYVEALRKLLDVNNTVPLAPSNKKHSDGIEIVSIVLGKAGGLTGEMNVVKECISINIDAEIKPNELSSVLREHVKNVVIDDFEYPYRDPSDNKPAFMPWQGAYSIFAAYPLGIQAVEDFKKRDKHKVVINFDDGSKVEHTDQGYVKPDREPQSATGIAAKYKIVSTAKITDKYDYDNFVINFDKKIEYQDFNKIKEIKIEGSNKIFSKDKFEWSSSQISSKDGDVVRVAENNGNFVDTKVIIKFEDGSILKKSESGSGGQTPNIASQYKIEKTELVTKWGTTELKIHFDKNISLEWVNSIKNITINGKLYDQSNPEANKRDITDLGISMNTILSTSLHSDVIAQAKLKDPISIIIQFKDGSILKNAAAENEKPQTNMAAEHKLTGVKTKEDMLFLGFETSLYPFQLRDFSKISVNGREFEFAALTYVVSEDNHNLHIQNSDIVQKAKEKDPVDIVITFADLTKIEKSIAKTVEKIASKYEIESAAANENYNGKKGLVVNFDKDIETDKKIFKTVNINGQDFALSEDKLTVGGKVLFIEGEDILKQAKKKVPVEIKLVFSDDSKLEKNIGEGKEPGLTIDSELPDGDYTLGFNAYQYGENKPSSVGGYLDERVKLHIEGNKKTVSFLNHSFAELLLDMAIKDDNENITRFSKNLVEVKNGKPQKAEYSIDLPDLKGKKVVYVLVAMPGSQVGAGDIGDYSKYKKIQIVFKDEVTKGFRDYKVIEDEKSALVEEDKNLIDALAEAGVDTNNDGQISKEELKNAKGKTKELPSGNNKYKIYSNVLDLENKKIKNVSMLRDLGPNIDAIVLASNQIVELPHDVFANATNIRAIFLDGNRIEKIDKDAFSNLSKLEHIQMDGNRFTELPDDLFRNNPKLQLISIANTNLSRLGSNFIKNQRNLQNLYIYENKSLTHLPDDFFEGQKNSEKLTNIHFELNNLDNLPSSLGYVTGLSVLKANGNEIKEIPDTFSNLVQLTEADFSYNRITSVPDELYTNMALYSKYSNKEPRLQFSNNMISDLPIEKIFETYDNNTKKFARLELNMNYLNSDVSKEDREKLEKIGVKFESDKWETYYPQKTNMKTVATAENGVISLKSDLDLLELIYWDKGDLVGGYSSLPTNKASFLSNDEFLSYFNTFGRDANGVSRDLKRNKAALEILKSKIGNDFKVNTVITKNGSVIYEDRSALPKEEGLLQTFKDDEMKKGDRYILTKSVYENNNIYGFMKSADFDIEFTANSDAKAQNENEKYNVDVWLKKDDNSNEKSMADRALVKPAKVEKIGDNTYRYTVTFKPMEVLGREGNITKFSIFKNGNKQLITPTVKGKQREYTFELNEKANEVKAEILADVMEQMNMKEQKVILVFNWDKKPEQPKPDQPKPEQPKEEKPVVTNIKTKVENGVATAVVNEAEVQKLNKEIKKSENTSVELKVDTENKDVKEIKTSIPESLFKAVKEADKKVTVTTKSAKINLDSKVVKQLAGKGDIEVSVKETTLDLKKLPNNFRDKIDNSRPVRDLIITADGNKIGNFAGKITVEIPYKKKLNEDSRAITPYYIKEDGSVQEMTDSVKYDGEKLSFKTDHFSTFAVGYDKNKLQTSGSSDELSDGVHTVSAWLRKENSNEESMAGKALSENVKVVKNGSIYKYTITFVPLEILGRTGHITSFAIDRNGTKEVIAEVSDGVYEFELDYKAKELKVYLKADIMDELGLGEQRAFIMFNWDGANTKPVKIERDLNVKVLDMDTNKESIINKFINPIAKLVEESGKYKYTVEFKTIKLNDKSGDITSFNIYNGQDSDTISPTKIDNDDYIVSYTFTFDEKPDKVKASIKADNVIDTYKDVYLVFTETNEVKKDNKQDKKKEVEQKLKKKVEKILSKEERKYYKKQTLESLEKAFEAFKKGEKDSEAKLRAVLEIARLEKVTTLLQLGYMVGYPENKFMPNKQITVAEASVMFANLIDEETNEMPVTKAKTWYSKGVNKLVALGYIKVEKDTKLDPDRAITRAEYAYILAKLGNYKDGTKSLKDVKNDYWAAKEISSLVEKGIISGYKDGSFKPDNTITRAEACSMVNRAFNLKADISNKKPYSDVKKDSWAYEAIMTAAKK